MKKKLNLALAIYLFLQMICLQAQNVKSNKKVVSDVLKNKIAKELDDYKKLNFHEKIYLHFDKPFYAVGEDMWYSVYLVNAEDHSNSVPSNIVYVELINPKNEIVSTKTLKVKEGKASGDFKLEDSLKPGDFVVRAYTNYMRNYDQDFFYIKRINIKNYNTEVFASNNKEKGASSKAAVKEEKNLTDIDFQFFPEGGDLIEGLPSVVGFKALNSFGKGIDIEGGVFNQKGEMITFFKSDKYGIGSFNFKPENGFSYTAKCKIADNEYEFQLPEAKPEGYVMRVDNSDDTQIKILLKNNISKGIKNATLIGQTRGTIAFSQDLFPDQNEVQVKVDKSALKDGILHLTLFDGKGLPQAERLVFIYNEAEKVTTKVNTDKEEYFNRKPVKVAVAIKDKDGMPIGGNLSVSVTNTELVSHDKNAENIRSYLLLSADLKGNIENPNYYLYNINKEKKRALDHLMLTHGWRRFSWKDIQDGKENEVAYLPEKGFNISGNIANFYKPKQLKKGKVKLLLMSDNEYVDYEEVETSENGSFTFLSYDIPENTDVILKAEFEKKRKNKTKVSNSSKINIKEFENAPVGNITASYTNVNALNEDYARQLEKIKTFDKIYNFDKDVKVLEELTVKSTNRALKDPYYSAGRPYLTPDHRVVLEDVPGISAAQNAMDVIARANIPGVRVGGVFPFYNVTIRAGAQNCKTPQPIILLDDMIVDVSVLNNLSASDIHYIDVIKNSTVYGVRGAGGAISVYTKLANGIEENDNNSKGSVTYKTPSYDLAREYYSPKYKIEKPEHAKPDHKVTLYWNPTVKTNDKGEAEIEFYTSDDNAKFRIDIQGITEKGQPLLVEKTFTVR